MIHFCEASKKNAVEFKPQDLSNTMWSAATLGFSPPADWMNHFLEASKQKMATLNSKDFSQTIWALAVSRHRPIDAWLQLFLDASLNKSYIFNAQDLSTILWGLAALGVAPGADWMDAWATRVAALIDTLPSRNAVNSLWALTVLQMQDSGVFWSLLQQAFHLLTPESDGRDLYSIYDVLQIAAAKKVDGLPTPDASLLEVARKAWNRDLVEQAQQRASFDHQAVMSVLGELGVAHEQEHFCLQTGRSIDIALLDRRIAIEVDGPSHFLNTQKRTDGTLLRNRVLKGAGSVVSIPFFEWDALKSMSAQKEYIQRKLSSTGR